MTTDEAMGELDREPVEVLAEDFLARRRRGEAVSVAEFAARHPDLAGKITELFPMLVEIEDIKSQRERAVQAATPSVPKALRQLGDFRIVREIGRGGMGIVYEAVQQSLGRRVAVKVLLRHASLDEKQLRRFQREARTAAQLHHTNIVPVFGVGEENGLHYFVMQYIAGVGLDAVLAQLQAGAGGEAGATETSPDTGPVSRAVEALLRGEYAAPRRPGSASGADAPVRGSSAPAPRRCARSPDPRTAVDRSVARLRETCGRRFRRGRETCAEREAVSARSGDLRRARSGGLRRARSGGLRRARSGGLRRARSGGLRRARSGGLRRVSRARPIPRRRLRLLWPRRLRSQMTRCVSWKRNHALLPEKLRRRRRFPSRQPRPSAASLGLESRQWTPSNTPTRRAFCIAISSRPTCCSMPKAPSG
jgi:hypothetical protein